MNVDAIPAKEPKNVYQCHGEQFSKHYVSLAHSSLQLDGVVKSVFETVRNDSHEQFIVVIQKRDTYNFSEGCYGPF